MNRRTFVLVPSRSRRHGGVSNRTRRFARSQVILLVPCAGSSSLGSLRLHGSRLGRCRLGLRLGSPALCGGYRCPCHICPIPTQARSNTTDQEQLGGQREEQCRTALCYSRCRTLNRRLRPQLQPSRRLFSQARSPSFSAPLPVILRQLLQTAQWVKSRVLCLHALSDAAAPKQ